ncbi:MAG: hypothetical protein R3195_00270 [Gemmatimonadota bacterium]|nr:hypothetical protein [Gemmatimonadota bacterium]
MDNRRLVRLLALTLLVPAAAPDAVAAQTHPAAADVASPEAIVSATYESIARAPGERYDWVRFESLFLPGASLIPSIEQTNGSLRVLSVRDFIDWIDAGTTVGGAGDHGFSEDGIHNVTERYGDIAHVFSTYEKHLYGQTENLGRGINTFQMIFNDGRWWITSIAWDEEIGAGPIPAKYLPGGGDEDVRR